MLKLLNKKEPRKSFSFPERERDPLRERPRESLSERERERERGNLRERERERQQGQQPAGSSTGVGCCWLLLAAAGCWLLAAAAAAAAEGAPVLSFRARPRYLGLECAGVVRGFREAYWY